MDFAKRIVSNNQRVSAQLTPVVKWLLISNIAIYFADVLFFGYFLRKNFSFTIQSGLFEFQVWKFVSFQFIHGSVGHVLFNCMSLFFFGPWMERWWGLKHFITFYLTCGAAGALFYTAFVYLGILPQSLISAPTGGFNFEVPASQIPLMGASAGVYGILVGVAVIAPNMRVSLLLPPITLTMRQLAIALLVISTGAIVLRWGGNEGGEAGHLGGAVMGFLWMKFYPKSRNSVLFPWSLNRNRHLDYVPKIRPRTSIDLSTISEVDEILDKISREGFQSLTEKEREILDQAVKKSQNSES